MAGPTGNESNHMLDGLTVRGGLALEGTGGVQTYINRDVAANGARKMACMRGMGYWAETCDRQTAVSSAALTSQLVTFSAVGLLAGDVVTNLTVGVGVAGVSVTMAKIAIYSKTGTLLASTANLTTTFESTGVKTAAVTTPYTVLTDDLYYAAVLAVTASTIPNLRSGHTATSTGTMAAVGSGVMMCGAMAAQSDMPASATIATNNSATFVWVAVS